MLAVSVVVAACGGSEEGETGFNAANSPDASATGGSGMFVPTGGSPGVSGAGGTAGSPGASGAPPAVGSCNPAFCPEVGGGMRCCVAADGPCGMDTGTGCVSALGAPDGG
jgi:pilus assembly protein FimV